jgi:hypothetical protein
VRQRTTIRSAPAQGHALVDAEAVLLVDDDQPQAGESQPRLDQRLRADQDVQLAVGRGRVGARALFAFDRARQQGERGPPAQRLLELGAGRLKEPVQGAEVLLGQDLRRRHEHALEPVGDGIGQCQGCHGRLP